MFASFNVSKKTAVFLVFIFALPTPVSSQELTTHPACETSETLAANSVVRGCVSTGIFSNGATLEEFLSLEFVDREFALEANSFESVPLDTVLPPDITLATQGHASGYVAPEAIPLPSSMAELSNALCVNGEIRALVNSGATGCITIRSERTIEWVNNRFGGDILPLNPQWNEVPLETVLPVGTQVAVN